ncbi:MAG TPA: beta/gamma crystallin-related protein [Usitatibacter sp.]|nr:beta/gamma crystallin-related protein [Usitatibacter sp.]
MKPNTLRAAIAAALLFAGAASAGQVTIYKQPNFTGESRTFNGEDLNLADNGINDQASSIIVKSGRWQFCSQPNFKGDCQVLEPGQYATLPQVLNHRIESFREVAPVVANDDKRYGDARRGDGRDSRGDDRRDGRYADDRRDGRYADNRYNDGPRGRRWERGSIELFSSQAFRGRNLLVERDAAEIDMYDVSSVIVHDGTWEVCAGSRFEGPCRTLEPGRYPTLGRMDNRVVSVRRVG